MLSIKKWEKILREATKAGAHQLSISGGEPFLYQKLPKLVSIAKEKDFFVNINTNASLITKANLIKLKKVGLDSLTISLHSLNSHEMDKIKKIKGLLKQIKKAIKLIKKTGILLTIQSILSKNNYKSFDKLIRFDLKNKADGIAISYPEADYSTKNLLMNKKQILEFKTLVLPKIIKLINKSHLKNKEQVIKKFQGVYNWKDFSLTNAAKGIFKKNGNECKIPFDFALILQNGDVLPCNAIEYFHTPIIGNVEKKSLTTTLNSKKMRLFQKNKISQCKYCPMELSFKTNLIY